MKPETVTMLVNVDPLPVSPTQPAAAEPIAAEAAEPKPPKDGRIPGQSRLPLRGHHSYEWFVNRVIAVFQWALAGLRYVWKARLLAHWRLSPSLKGKDYKSRMTTCGQCDKRKVNADRLYPDRDSSYCLSCNCLQDWAKLLKAARRVGVTGVLLGLSSWGMKFGAAYLWAAGWVGVALAVMLYVASWCARRWSELTVKNGRVGHFCPLGLHAGSEYNSKGAMAARGGRANKGGGCGGGGCGGARSVEPASRNGNGQAAPLAHSVITRGANPSAHSVIARGANPSAPADNLR